ncbi:MAG: hypothetical protein ACJ73D_10290 [Pyrinomonadaceae bacterium]
MKTLDKLIVGLSTLVVAVLVICVLAGLGVAQATKDSDNCTVDSLDLSTKEGLNLGTFNTAIGKDLSSTEAFYIRGTDKLYLIARVLYTDELMETDESSGRGAESVSFLLWIVKSPNANAARVAPATQALALAEAQQPVAGFDIGRVMLISEIGSTQKSFMMKCWRAGRTRPAK